MIDVGDERCVTRRDDRAECEPERPGSHLERRLHPGFGTIAAGSDEIEIAHALALHLCTALRVAAVGDVLEDRIDAHDLAGGVLRDDRSVNFQLAAFRIDDAEGDGCGFALHRLGKRGSDLRPRFLRDEAKIVRTDDRFAGQTGDPQRGLVALRHRSVEFDRQHGVRVMLEEGTQPRLALRERALLAQDLALGFAAGRFVANDAEHALDLRVTQQRSRRDCQLERPSGERYRPGAVGQRLAGERASQVRFVHWNVLRVEPIAEVLAQQNVVGDVRSELRDRGVHIDNGAVRVEKHDRFGIEVEERAKAVLALNQGGLRRDGCADVLADEDAGEAGVLLPGDPRPAKRSHRAVTMEHAIHDDHRVGGPVADAFFDAQDLGEIVGMDQLRLFQALAENVGRLPAERVARARRPVAQSILAVECNQD